MWISLLFHVVHGLVALAAASGAAPSPPVEIRASTTFSRYASIEARVAGITWDPRLSFLPRSAADFGRAHAAGAWSASLDGPGNEREQLLMVRVLCPYSSISNYARLLSPAQNNVYCKFA